MLRSIVPQRRGFSFRQRDDEQYPSIFILLYSSEVSLEVNSTAMISVNPTLDDSLKAEMIDTWVEVTNTGGGGIGFLPPVSSEDVTPVASELFNKIHHGSAHLVVARDESKDLIGWLAVVRNNDQIQSHWAWLKRMHVIAPYQGKGVGTELLQAAVRLCREEGLVQLYLTTDGQSRAVNFYTAHGFHEVGRMPQNSLSLDGSMHDEVYMLLDLVPDPASR
jgi:GNAT superfamily N-acetyltransferase